MDKIASHITNWLLEYLDVSKQRGFVVGVSGGVDSALTSTLCAMTGKDTLCLEMAIHQPKDQVNRSVQHIDWLQAMFPNVRGISVNLTLPFEELKSTLSKGVFSEKTSLALANTRSRLRMMTLYYYATLHHFLVVGTGNKVEDFGIGFFTKYGDGGVDISPIADLTKTEVFNIAKSVGVSREILTAPPTDGLWDDDRTDEKQIGATYHELEWAMDMQEQGKSATDFQGREKQVFQIYNALHQNNLHKMKQIPICKIPKNIKTASH